MKMWWLTKNTMNTLSAYLVQPASFCLEEARMIFLRPSGQKQLSEAIFRRMSLTLLVS